MSEPRYLLSTLTTVYNGGRFIRGLLEDLEAQTIADRMQIVIVDSASPSGEREIIEEFQRRYDNILYTRTDEREGILAAMNRALALAAGTYVTPAPADDRRRTDAFEHLVAALEADPEIGLAYGDSAITNHENETFESAYERGRVTGHFRWPEFDPHLLFQVCCVGPQPVWRRALHDRLGGFDPDYRSAGDYELYLRFAAAGVRFRHVPDVLGLYLLAPGGCEHSDLELSRVESEQCRERHWPRAWGPRPRPGGYFVVPVNPGERLTAPKPRPVALAPVATPAVTPPVEQDQIELPLVSVIIPTCDRPQWLRRALESVLGQTYPRIEAIVVNDAGADVGDVVESLRGRGDIVSVRLARRGERSAARNAGLALARGTYVAYLDDDDWFHPEHVTTLVTALVESGQAVAYTDAQRVFEHGQGMTYVTRAIDVPYSRDFDRRVLRTGNYIPILCLMHRRDCLEKTGGFDEQLQTHEDWDLWIRLSQHYDFVHVPRVTCSFSWRTDGSSTTSERADDFKRTGALVRDRYAGQGDAPAPPDGEAYGLVRSEGEGPFTCSIIIPVFNKVELTAQCLTALAAVTQTPDFEVIVVDNASTDGTRELLTAIGGDVQVIRNRENLGFACACNQGAQAARGRHLVFLNNDTIPLADWLTPLVEELEADPGVAAAGSKLLFPDGTIQHAGVVFSRYRHTPYNLYQRLPGAAPEVNRRRELQAVTAACMAIRRDDFEAIGGFDEGFRNSFEDVDLCLRLRLRGSRIVYQPRSVVVHLESQSSGRHDHDAANAERLLSRWGNRFLEDEDVVYAEDGWRILSRVVHGQVLLDLVRAEQTPGAAAWEHLIAAERLALAGDRAALVELLEQPDAWPRDVVALQWAASLCQRAGRLPLAVPYLRAILDLADLEDVRAGLEALETALAPAVAGGDSVQERA